VRAPTRAHLHVLITVLLALALGYVGAAVLTQGKSASHTLADRYGLIQARLHAHPRRGVVPFLGTFRQGDCSKAVRIMETALARTPVPKHSRFDPKPPFHAKPFKPHRCFDGATKRRLAAFQASQHRRPSGVYNYRTHLLLVRHHAYTQRARRHLLIIARERVVHHQRVAVQIIARHLIRVAGTKWPYGQTGGRQNFGGGWPRIPPETDCSGAVIFMLYQAGAGPAVGYYGAGSIVGTTATLARQGREVPPGSRLEPGDVVLYPGHAALYIGGNMVVSHGTVGIHVKRWDYTTVLDVRRMIN
jgi:hypothetical protein